MMKRYGRIAIPAVLAAVAAALVITIAWHPARAAGGTGRWPPRREIAVTDAAVAEAGWSTVATIPLHGAPVVMIEIDVTGANGLDGFRLQHRSAIAGAWHNKWSDVDWEDSSNFAPGDWIGRDNANYAHWCHELASGECCAMILTVGPANAVRLQASGDGGATTVSVVGCAN